jgi:hypothetical protein
MDRLVPLVRAACKLRMGRPRGRSCYLGGKPERVCLAGCVLRLVGAELIPGSPVRCPGASLPAPASLDSILRLRLRGRLPLHVARRVRPATGERYNVVHDVAWPAVRMAGLPLEVSLRLGAPLDSPVRIALSCRCTGMMPRVVARAVPVRAGVMPSIGVGAAVRLRDERRRGRKKRPCEKQTHQRVHHGIAAVSGQAILA